MRSEELLDVRVLGELFQNQAHSDTGAADNRPSRQDLRIRGDQIEVGVLPNFSHSPLIISPADNKP
jgi:hypothetical protein